MYIQLQNSMYVKRNANANLKKKLKPHHFRWLTWLVFHSRANVLQDNPRVVLQQRTGLLKTGGLNKLFVVNFVLCICVILPLNLNLKKELKTNQKLLPIKNYIFFYLKEKLSHRCCKYKTIFKPRF